MSTRRKVGPIISVGLIFCLYLLGAVTAPNFVSAAPDYLWHARMIRADEVWSQGITGHNVMVGVIDSGVDTTHPGFGNRLKAMEFIDREGFYYNPADRSAQFDPWGIYQGSSGSFYLSAGGHGTSVSSLIGGKLVTQLPDGSSWNYQGIAFDSQLRVGSVRSNPKEGEPGYPRNATGADEVFGEPNGPIDWMLAQQVRIINNSWGSSEKITEFDKTATNNPVAKGVMKQLTLDGWRKVVNRDVLIVFSAGNDGKGPGVVVEPSLEGGLPYIYPELRKSWINAVALDITGKITSYSQSGGVAAAWTLSAPGGEWAENPYAPHDLTGIPGFRSRNMNGFDGLPFNISDYKSEGDDFLLPDNTTVADENSLYKQFLGTSAAAPVISGGAALVLQAHPDYTAQLLAQTLFTTANYSGIYADSAQYGWGLMDLAEAVKGPRYLRRALLLGLNPEYVKGQLVADVPADTAPALNNDMTGDGGLVKTGVGSLVLGGINDYSGDTDVLAGRLYVDGKLSGSVINLAAGSGIGGHGTIIPVGGLLIPSGAALAPGHSPTTLTVVGTVSQAAGSLFLPDLAGDRYSSRLAVTGAGNRYVLDITGVGVGLNPQFWQGYLPKVGDGYNVVTAEGGIEGTFGSLTLPAQMPAGQSFDVLYGASTLWMYATPTDYRQVSALGWDWNANQRQIARVWQANRPAPLVPLAAGEETLIYGTLFTLDASSLQAAASQLSGQLIVDRQAAGLDLLRGYNRNLATLLREQPAGVAECQVSQFSQWGQVQSQDVSGRNARGHGTLVSCDLVSQPDHRLGFGFAAIKGTATSLSGPGTAALEQTGGHLYWQYRPNPADQKMQTYWEGQLGLGWTEGKHDRQITAWGLGANGQAGGHHWLGRLAVGREQLTAKQRQGWSLALLAERLSRDGFAEAGDPLVRVSAAAARDSRLAAELAWQRSFFDGNSKGFRRLSEYRLSYTQELSRDATIAELTWRGEPLRIESQSAGSGALQASVGMSWETVQGWRLSAGLQGELRRDSSQIGVNASLSYRW